MADDEATKKRRRIRSSETIRSKSVKAHEAAKKPKKRGPVSRLIRLIGRPFAIFKRPLRWFGRHFIPRYFRNSFTELRQVTWPNRKQSRQLTLAVLAFAIVFAFLVSFLDLGLDKIFKKVFLHE